MKTLLLLFLFSFLALSCGKKAEKTTVKLRFASGALVSGIAQNGGLVVMGKARNHDQSFTLNGHQTDGMEIELIKDQWDFFAIGWEGTLGVSNQNFTGTPRCSFQTKVLEADSESVSFQMNEANCSLALPAPHNFYPHDPNLLYEGSIPEIIVSTCQNITSVPDPPAVGDCATGNTNYGLGRSILVKTYFGIGPDSGPQSPAGHIESHCFNVDESSQLKLPVGDPISKDGLPSFHFFSFTEASCQGESIEYKIGKGIVNGPEHSDQNSLFSLIGTDAHLFLEHNSQTVSDSGFRHDFFWGTGASGSPGSVPSQPNEYYRISDFSADGKTITTATTPSMIYPGDEIFWYVNDIGATTGCGSSAEKLLPGMYGWGHVNSISAMSITLEKPFNERGPDNPGSWEIPNSTDLAADTSSASYCSMQIVKVPNYLNLTLADNAYIYPLAYDHLNGIGGLLILKVKNTLFLDASVNPVGIKGFGKGMKNRATPDYSHCVSGIPCLRLGGSATTVDGGGAGMMIFAKSFKMKQSGTSPIFNVNGGNLSPDTLGRHAGQVILTIENIIFETTEASPGIFDDTDMDTMLTADGREGGNPGLVIVQYCSVTGDGNMITTKSPLGSSGQVYLNTNPGYCP